MSAEDSFVAEWSDEDEEEEESGSIGAAVSVMSAYSTLFLKAM